MRAFHPASATSNHDGLQWALVEYDVTTGKEAITGWFESEPLAIAEGDRRLVEAKHDGYEITLWVLKVTRIGG